MTEDEAKMKWCPFVRLLAETYTRQGKFEVSTGYSYNRSPDPDEDRAPYLPDGAACIGSACMAWRTLPQRGTVVGEKPSAVPFETERPQDYEGSPQWKVRRLPQQGGCGVAGALQ